jgi:hypothetical protein
MEEKQAQLPVRFLRAVYFGTNDENQTCWILVGSRFARPNSLKPVPCEIQWN